MREREQDATQAVEIIGKEVCKEKSAANPLQISGSSSPTLSAPGDSHALRYDHESLTRPHLLNSRIRKTTRKTLKETAASDDDEPLVDTTAALPLRSKKTERQQKRQQQKAKRYVVHSDVKSFLDLPSELLSEVFSHLRPSDVMRMLEVNQSTREFVLDHESSIARDIIHRRYWILTRSFPLPVPSNQLDPTKHAALLSPRWQANIGAYNRNPYQHIRRIDSQNVCSCSTCHMSWNNLCLILDLSHWQKNLNDREPIPKVERGRYPEWNTKLLNENAALVERALYSPLVYARILEKHLATITGTVLRFAKYRRKGAAPPPRLYHMTDDELRSGTDAFLARSGAPSYEFPFWRDNYYALGAYVPNRKWSKEEQRWQYPPPFPRQHDFDLDWAARWFRQDPDLEQKMDQYVEKLRRQLTR